MSELICTCHCGGTMFYRHLHASDCRCATDGDEAPESHPDNIAALRATSAQQAQELERVKFELGLRNEWAGLHADDVIRLKQQLTASQQEIKRLKERYEADRDNTIAKLQARCREMEARRFPIMRGPSVPWEVMRPHESMAQKNHSQTLQQLAERGGLAPGEAWCVVSGIQYGIASKEQWQLWDAEWFKYAERVNLHYGNLAHLQATLAARELELEEYRSLAEKVGASKAVSARGSSGGDANQYGGQR